MRKLAQIQAFNGGFSPNIELTSSNWGALTTATAWRNKFIADGQTNVVVSNFTLNGNNASFYLKTASTNWLIDLRFLNITVVNKMKVSGVFFLNLISNNIVNFNPTTQLPNLQWLVMNDNQMTSFSQGLPNQLQYLRINNNLLTSFTVPLPSNLLQLELQNNKFTSLSGFPNIPSSCNLVHLAGNLITTAGYTASEVWATAQATTANCTIRLNGNANSASGTTFASILTSKGYTFIY